MIHGTGIDLVEVERIKDAIERFGERFLHRVYTEQEIAYCNSKSNRFLHFSARFACKEAVIKCLGLGISIITLNEIEITNEESGTPVVRFFGRTKDMVERIGHPRLFLSISHTKRYAIAQAVAWRPD
jgi:holo-[acyl-carrier protein] synthase